MRKSRWISVLMASFLLAGCGSGQAQTQTSAGAKTGDQEAAAEKSGETAGNGQTDDFLPAQGSVRILASVTGGKDEEEMKLFEKALSDATGLTVTIEKPASDYDKILMQKLSGGEKYDLIYLNAPQYLNLIQQDALMDLTKYKEQSKILTGNIDPQEWKDITVDGKVYAGFNKKEVHRVVALNNTLLKEAGIDYKTIEPTMDGYYQVLKTLKDKSKKTDFYPFEAVMSQAWDLQPYMAAAGAKEGVLTDENGKRYAPYAQDDAAVVWEWFKKLYDNGLMDPASFVDETKNQREKMGASSQNIAMCADWAAWVGLHNAGAKAAGVTEDQYEIISLPGLKTPDGSYMLGKGGASLFAVPANAENPEGAIRVLEYFATQEGGNLLSSGIEGHDYTVSGNEYKLTEEGAAHGNDHGAPFPIFKDYKPLFDHNPGVDEAMSYAKYASIDTIIPNEGDYKEIVGKWGIQIIKGDVDAKTGLKKMREELVERGVTDR